MNATTSRTSAPPKKSARASRETLKESVLPHVPSPSKSTKMAIAKHVVFRFSAPSAREVSLVADFTGWNSSPLKMVQNPSGQWQISVPLPPGRHRYKFLVDGSWQEDLACALQEPNPFGS